MWKSNAWSWIAWCCLSLAAGAAVHWLIGLSFWWSLLIAAVALTLNGVLAYWEDRGEWND